jgi:hypothetical protein
VRDIPRSARYHHDAWHDAVAAIKARLVACAPREAGREVVSFQELKRPLRRRLEWVKVTHLRHRPPGHCLKSHPAPSSVLV